jgi:hypothetical protein
VEIDPASSKSMKTFTQGVRSGDTKGPQQRGFKIEDWHTTFDLQGKGNSEDAELHFAGTWFHREFVQIRSITADALNCFKWATPRDRLCAFVGFAVLQWSILLAAVRKKVDGTEGQALFISELEKIPVKSPHFKQVDPAGAIEIMVDGLRFPLSLPHAQQQSSVPFGCGTVKELDAFTKLVLTGQHYHVIEEHWLDCVWNDYRIISDTAVKRLEPRNLEQAKQRVISKFRRDRIIVQPLVLSSSPFLSGWARGGVPVCDWFILRRFFAEGELALLARPMNSGELKPGLTQKFYNTPEEAVQIAFKHFCDTPQVQMFEPFVEIREHPLTFFEAAKIRTVFVYPSVQLPHQALRGLAEVMHKAD